MGPLRITAQVSVEILPKKIKNKNKKIKKERKQDKGTKGSGILSLRV